MKVSRIVLVLMIIVVAIAVWAITVYGPTFDYKETMAKMKSSYNSTTEEQKQQDDSDNGESAPTEKTEADPESSTDVKTEGQSKAEEDKSDESDEATAKESGEKTEPESADKSVVVAAQGPVVSSEGGTKEETPKSDEKTDKSEDEDEDKEPEDIGDPNDPLVAINLNNIDMKTVIQTIGDWTELPIIPTDDKIMAVKVTIYAKEKVPQSVALSLLSDALRAKGYIVEHAQGKIYLKPLASAKLGAVPTFGPDEPLAKIKDKSQIIEKFFKLSNYSPSSLAKVIAPLIAEYGHVTAVEDADSISVIDTVENLMRIERVIAQFDVPESEQTVEKVFEIKNADVLEVVQVLQMILDKGKSSRSPSKSNQPKPGQNKVMPATSIIIAPGQIPVKLIPIPKQNWIIATGSSEDIERIEEWITKLDISESVKQEQSIIQVEFADVSEVARIIKRNMADMPGSDLRTNVVVEALPGSRQIVVFGSADNRKMVERMVFEIDIPTEDVFEEETFKLKHADPEQIKENIDGLYGQEASSGNDSYYYYRYGAGSQRTDPKKTVKVIAYPTMNQVTVIASAENMKKIKAQIAEWDVPLDIERDQYRLITLKNSDPVKLVELLSRLFSEDDSGSNSSLMNYFFGRRGGGDDNKKKIVGSLYGMLTFEAIPDTKKIIVISKIPEAYDVIEKLIMELDSQEMAEVPQVVILNYADAEDLCDQLNAILNESGTTATIKRRAQGLTEYQSPTDTSSNSGDNEATDPGEIKPWWDQQRTNRDDEMPTSNLIGQVRFIPVHRSKAILVLAPPEYLPAIKEMIEMLDKPEKQVMIKVIIVEVDHNKMTNLGLRVATNPAAFGTLGENALNALTSLTSTRQNGSVTATYSLNVNTLVDLLSKNVDAKVLNQPTLWTKDNEEAIFFKGTSIALLEGDQSDTTGQSIKSSYDYTDIGVTLGVRPNITPERAVDVTLHLEISQVTDSPNSQVAFSKLDTTTSLIVNDGETIMLGGILYQTESEVKSKVPLLGDIPLLGGVFSHEDTQARNSELLVFITPYVIDGPNTTEETINQLEESKYKMEEIVEHLDEIFNPAKIDTKENK